MYMVRITYLSKHSRFRMVVTLYLDHWSRNNVVGIVTRLRAGRFGVRIQEAPIDFYFLQGIALEPI